MPNKPANLIYGVDDSPPLLIIIGLALQHISVISITMVFPVLVIRIAGGSLEDIGRLVSCSLIAGGIGTILQSRVGQTGSGYLCPQVCGPSFLSASILAVKTGGLSLLFGMTVIAGLFEVFFSRVMRYLRFLFPAEVTGLIVMMVGLTITRFVMNNFFGLNDQNLTLNGLNTLVASATLAMMVGLNVWGKGKFKLFCVAIGMVGGYVLSFFTGFLTVEQLAGINSVPIFAFPISGHPGWSFDISLIAPFIIAMVCSSFKTVGDLTTCQKINDTEWLRPDMENVSRGILADALGCLSSGLLGGLGQSTSSSNIGLSVATGATSRKIGMAIGIVAIILSCCPKISYMFAIMPPAVIGATLVLALSFMVVAGMQIIMSRMMDGRKTFVVGLSLTIGLSVDIIPSAWGGVPHWISPLVGSALSAATVCAVILNLIFRLGIAAKIKLALAPGENWPEQIFSTMESQGAAWGARHDIINRAAAAMNEFMEARQSGGQLKQDVVMEVSFDEYNLDIAIAYQGKPFIVQNEAPGSQEVLESDEAMERLASFMVCRQVDKIRSLPGPKESHILQLHLEH